MTRNDCLRPLPLISSADSIDLGSRTRPDTLQRIVASLAEEFRHSCFIANQFVAIDWKFTPCFALPILKRLNAIIEPCDGHTAFTIMERGQQLGQRRDRILDGASKNAGMQIIF